MNEKEIQKEIDSKGLNAPRVTPQTVDAQIVGEYFFTAYDGAYADKPAHYTTGTRPHSQALGLLTFCVLVLRNGFTVTGESACASPENFDAELGRKIARNNARSKIWPLEAYALRNKLSGI